MSQKQVPNGDGFFTSTLGILVKKDNLGFGGRFWRYSMIVDNKNIEKVFIEDVLSDDFGKDPFEAGDV